MTSDRSDSGLVQLPRPGEVIDDRYRLKKVFDSGGMGVIMLAEQMRTGRDVAVKLLHPHIATQQDFAARFQREAKVATLFHHSSIVRVYDVGETDEGLLYLVMELLDGVELKDIIKAEAPLPTGRVIAIAGQFLDGLAEAHSQGVVHRDLKPGNIFVSRDRRGNEDVKILDFGIAKLTNAQQTQVTETGKITGTPAYMAPEVLVAEDRASQKPVDVYAAGLIILEMLTGRQAFAAESMAQTLIKQLKKPVPIPETIAKTSLGDVLRKATAKHPGDRYGDADEMLEAFKEASAGIDPDLQLDTQVFATEASETSPSILDELMEHGPETGLAILRDLPQHVEVGDGDSQQSAGPSHTAEQTNTDAPAVSQSLAVDVQKTSGSWSGGPTKIVIATAAIVAVLAALVFVFEGANGDVEDGPVSDVDTLADRSVERPAPEPMEEGPAVVAVHLQSEPEGALVWMANQVLGRTPVTLDFEKAELPQEIRLEHDGYNPEVLEIAVDEDVALDIAMQERSDGDDDIDEPPEADSYEPIAADDPALPTVRQPAEADSEDYVEVEPASVEEDESDDSDDPVLRLLGRRGDDNDDEADEAMEADVVGDEDEDGEDERTTEGEAPEEEEDSGDPDDLIHELL